jgi:outer membrane immunogenic protein
MKNTILKTLLLSTALTVASSSFAFAEGWTGFRIGAGGGGSYGTSSLDSFGAGIHDDIDGANFGFAGTGSVDVGDLVNTEEVAQIINTDPTEEGFLTGLLSGVDALTNPSEVGDAGAFGAVELGYDFEMSPSVVVGVSADYGFGKTTVNQDDMGLTLGADESGAYAAGVTSLSNSLELGNSWAAGGRLGFAPTEKTLIFASGGYTQVKTKLSAKFDGLSYVGDETETGAIWEMDAVDTMWLSGYYVGGGMETILTSNLSMKIEYRYTDLEKMAVENDNFTAESDEVAGVTSEVDPNIHSVRVTIGIRF